MKTTPTTPNLELLEACYRANVGRRHLCMESWDSCLIGGYSPAIAKQVDSLSMLSEVQYMNGRVRLDTHPVYIYLADHFSITPQVAVKLFVGHEVGKKVARTAESALSRLRQFIDANTPANASLDFKRNTGPTMAQPREAETSAA